MCSWLFTILENTFEKTSYCYIEDENADAWPMSSTDEAKQQFSTRTQLDEESSFCYKDRNTQVEGDYSTTDLSFRAEYECEGYSYEEIRRETPLAGTKKPQHADIEPIGSKRKKVKASEKKRSTKSDSGGVKQRTEILKHRVKKKSISDTEHRIDLQEESSGEIRFSDSHVTITPITEEKAEDDEINYETFEDIIGSLKKKKDKQSNYEDADDVLLETQKAQIEGTNEFFKKRQEEAQEQDVRYNWPVNNR